MSAGLAGRVRIVEAGVVILMCTCACFAGGLGLLGSYEVAYLLTFDTYALENERGYLTIYPSIPPSRRRHVIRSATGAADIGSLCSRLVAL